MSQATHMMPRNATTDEQKEAETDYEMEDPFAILKPPAADESSDDSELEAVAIVTNYEDSRVSTKWNVTKPHPVQTMVSIGIGRECEFFRDPIFAKGHTAKISQSNFRGWSSCENVH